MTIWDVTRLLWLARPEYCEDEGLHSWLQDRRRRRFRLWGYIPIDATGLHNRLSAMSKECLLGFDRLLAYSPHGMSVIRNTIGESEAEKRGLEWLPHGLNLKTFSLRPVLLTEHACTREEAEHVEPAAVELMPQGIKEESSNVVSIASVSGGSNEVIHTVDHSGPAEPCSDGVANHHVPAREVKRIGVVATNQARKEWGLAAATCAGIAERLKGNVKFWWHCDTAIRHFNLHALIADFQLGEMVELTSPPMSDGEMAERLRACDLTLHTGSEGFGFNLFQSLACGVPVLHGDYAGGASILSTCGLSRYLIEPVAWRLEGQHNCLRPVYEPADWVNAAIDVLAIAPEPAWLASRVDHLSYLKLGYVWQRWFREGLGEQQS